MVVFDYQLEAVAAGGQALLDNQRRGVGYDLGIRGELLHILLQGSGVNMSLRKELPVKGCDVVSADCDGLTAIKDKGNSG